MADAGPVHVIASQGLVSCFRSTNARHVHTVPAMSRQSLRRLVTLAIETSCDDTSVAVLEKGVQHGHTVATLHFHAKVTSNNTAHQGVHPLVSLQSHQENLANLVSQAIRHLPRDHAATPGLPDCVSVTRGPGMRSNLFTGLDTAKGLAVAWQRPLVGVHHMQAHALTPRLVDALSPTLHRRHRRSHAESQTAALAPDYPFLSVLASGGHTMVIASHRLTEHKLLGVSNDIAVGECLDKVARAVLPPKVLQTAKSTMYGALLEEFAFEEGTTEAAQDEPPSPSNTYGCSAQQYLAAFGHRYPWYQLPENHEVAVKRSKTKWGWGFNQPLTKSGGGTKMGSMEMSFSGLLTAVERAVWYHTDPSTNKQTNIERSITDVSDEERICMAREAMRAAFEHIASRSSWRVALLPTHFSDTSRGCADVQLYFPPPEFCTDNAAMIGWAGLEMFEAGHTDPLSIRAIRKWPLDRILDAPKDT
ncbi:hypothetical protein P153DRAFT_382904 [Dothidotthia symphoricarpi CBS 119687]|uniref:N(6)-L-threonylcarbamoyladenine synthase n=1 Tax=Dothidotthia symphoricarpi CBS 119687 TaxID=1392245 RepID=A0A6A6ANE6_9PLEO|nr:uncharacterized protein P153DRAFT_382904 [Dothidotthia symphoricarpi CBS 119687]KAF2132011.1 hypothetical protein P153DRAFT_382904 [Dothidotthia symphoricarpi CBS 119687]